MHFKNGRFKILVLADIHSPDVMPKWTRDFIEKVRENEKPDLIVLLGDNTGGAYRGFTEEKTKQGVKQVLSVLGDTPFCLVFGNHDHEGLPSLGETQAKKLLLELYGESENCLAVFGEQGVSGVGNYRLNIKDSGGERDLVSLWFFDSGTYKNGGYGCVEEDQIAWFESVRKYEKHLPAIAFQHIIVPEIYTCLDKSPKKKEGYVRGQCAYKQNYYALSGNNTLSGSLKEGPCPPDESLGQFASWTKDSKVIAGVFGHDHVNDFDVVLDGIRLIACPSPSFFTYGNNRGVRIITLDEAQTEKITTRVIHYDEYIKSRPLNPFVKAFGIQAYEGRWRPLILGASVFTAASAVLIKRIIKR